ncbi:ABC transporter ATP-binding protein [Paenibacillus agri]|uniref:ATP-binding cassette domain-containing protein n=1 Tax=Paenibacillus agri TaxID=2744309 RepID=A0A850EUA8_9BACL|nr:ATP-binding cassette domain-containing protein [Paenibacillus agri]NUU63440.1 ATP-binding cassette domain-containing protein [Paenibacillus agri]
MEIITADRLSFRYPDEARDSLHELSFTVREGEFVVLCGPSGCGKTTLLRHLKRELTPVGTGSGTVCYRGLPLGEWSPEIAAAEIGMVFQNPEAQIVMDTVWHELAFSMENLGYPLSVMRSRLAEIAGLFGLEPLLYKPVHELSGGQKQLLNLASVLVLQPKVLLLDEPTSQLDPIAAREFIQMLRRLNEEMSVTVIISEHRLEEVLPLADRVLMLEDGKLKAEGTPREIAVKLGGGAASPSDLAYFPAATRVYLGLTAEAALEGAGPIPLTVREGKQWLQREWRTDREGEGARPSAEHHSAAKEAGGSQRSSIPSDRPSEESVLAEEILKAREITFRYEKEGPEVLKKLSLSLFRGELLAILGGNGAGKSTLLHLLNGLAKPQRGRIDLAKGSSTGYLAQNPLLYFSQDTARAELRQMAEYGGLSATEAQEEIDGLLDIFELGELLERHPHDLSGGQQQKLALGMVLLLRPDILLLDEPTKGLDPAAKEKLASLLLHLRELGKSIIVVTHDVEFAASYATRCALLFDGGITAEGPPETFFSANYFYTTAVNRMVRDWLPQALTVEEVTRQWPAFASRS